MNSISQQQLSAYIDNELPAAERQCIDEALAASATLRAELEQLRIADQAARDWFDDIDNQPMPEGLEQLIKEAPLSGAEVIPLRRKVPAPLWGLAASLLLAVGLVWQMQPGASVDSELQQFADTALSGDVFDGGTWKAELVMSWQQNNGTYCRELVKHTPQASTLMTACGAPGDWTWQIQENHNQYQTAAGPDSTKRKILSADAEQHWLSQVH